MDEFKQYINQRVEELDIDMPSEEVWQSIKQDLAPVKHNSKFVYMKWTVAACVITLAGFGLYKLQITSIITTPTTNQQLAINNQLPTTTKQQPVTSIQQPATQSPVIVAKVDMPDTKIQGQKIKAKDAINPSNYNPQTLNAETAIALLAQVENSFTQIINLQKAKVNTTPLNAESPNYFNDFTIQIKRMERDEQTVKNDITKNGLTDALLDQLINIYQQKLSVLKQLQIEINKTNNRFKQNRGPEESTKTYFLNI